MQAKALPYPAPSSDELLSTMLLFTSAALQHRVKKVHCKSDSVMHLHVTSILVQNCLDDEKFGAELRVSCRLTGCIQATVTILLSLVDPAWLCQTVPRMRCMFHGMVDAILTCHAMLAEPAWFEVCDAYVQAERREGVAPQFVLAASSAARMLLGLMPAPYEWRMAHVARTQCVRCVRHFCMQDLLDMDGYGAMSVQEVRAARLRSLTASVIVLLRAIPPMPQAPRGKMPMTASTDSRHASLCKDHGHGQNLCKSAQGTPVQ